MRKGNRKKGVGCRNFETTEGLRTGSPAGDVDSHNIVCSWCAQAHVSIHECVLQTDIFKGKKSIESKVSQKKELQAGEMLASRVPVYGTNDAGRGLWLRLKNTCKQFNFSLNQILPTLFTLRSEESKIIAVMPSNVDDLLYGSSPGRSRSHELCVATILGWQKKNTVLSGFVGKEDRQDEDFGMRTTNEHWNPWNEKCWKPCGHTEEERLCGRQTSTKTRRRPRADYAERHNRQDEDFGIHVTAKDRYFSCL